MTGDEGTSGSRRRFLLSAGAAGAALCLGSQPARLWTPRNKPPAERDDPVAQSRRAALTDPITVQRMRGNLSSIIGSGGNIVMLEDGGEVLLVDSGMVGARVAAAVASVTAAPIRYLVNTHWHYDHTDANPWLGEHGAAIIAHQNTRRHLSEATRVEDFGYTFEPLAASGLPHTVFTDRHALQVGATTVSLQHYPPAHTDSDLAVRFDHADVMHVADTWWNGTYPFIDYSTGGSINGLIAATESNLARTSAGTLIVPGHGPVGDRNQLKVYHEMLATARERIARLKRHGSSVAEVIRMAPMAAFDPTWGNGLINPAFFTRLVYRGV